MTNDLLSALDRGKEVVLILLDLSAAFDTIDHAALLSRLKAYFGIQDRPTALAWFKSYLEGRQQSVSINGTMSETKILKCGVPQGSVLGPILFIMYTAPLENLIKSHNLDCMMYADDTQLFLSFDPKQLGATCDRLHSCIRDVREWMVTNMLKLNDDKTEIIHLSSRFRSSMPLEFVTVDQSNIVPSSYARNIGKHLTEAFDWNVSKSITGTTQYWSYTPLPGPKLYREVSACVCYIATGLLQ